MNRLILVSDHPFLHRGFATVGHNIALDLGQDRQWEVDYIGRYSPLARKAHSPYRIHGWNAGKDGNQTGLNEHLARTLTSLAKPAEPNQLPVTLLSIGTGQDQAELLDVLQQLGLRDRFLFVAYVPIDFAPVPRPFLDLLFQFDLFVPFTEYAKRAVEAVSTPETKPRIALPIPHGVDTRIFHKPDPVDREQIRRSQFAIAPGDFLIGYFGRNSSHKHPDLAVRIFHLFATGGYAQCEGCSKITSSDLDPITFTASPLDKCKHCGSFQLRQGDPHPTARLYLHTDLSTKTERLFSGGWDLERLIDQLGIRSQVMVNQDLEIGSGIPVEELALRMGACDVHLLPYDSGGWELTVLETASCGVPNVITDFAAPPEYAAPFSELVPVQNLYFDEIAIRGIIDFSAAVEALLKLEGDPAYRRLLGERGAAEAARYDWSEVVGAWRRLLTECGAGRMLTHTAQGVALLR